MNDALKFKNTRLLNGDKSHLIIHGISTVSLRPIDPVQTWKGIRNEGSSYARGGNILIKMDRDSRKDLNDSRRSSINTYRDKNLKKIRRNKDRGSKVASDVATKF